MSLTKFPRCRRASRLPIRWLAVACGLAVLGSAPGSATIFRVDPVNGIDVGTCGTAATPCKTIQKAALIPLQGTTQHEIRLAGGVYAHDASYDGVGCNANLFTKPVVCIANRNLLIRGGFAPPNWTSPDPGANPSIIDGGHAFRGVAVRNLGIATTAEFRGVVIRNSRAQGDAMSDCDVSDFGGGMLADLATVILRDVEFTANRVVGATPTAPSSQTAGGSASGGALALRGALAGTHLENVVFDANVAQGGGGSERGGLAIGGALYTFDSVVTGINLTFRNNQALAGSSSGDGSAPLPSCKTTVDELADAQGGGFAVHEGSDVTFSNLVVDNNVAQGGGAGGAAGGAFGGGGYAERSVLLSLTDVSFTGNEARGGAGGQTGGLGFGGGLHAGTTTTVNLDRVKILDNQALGGDGTNYGSAAGGGVMFNRPASGQAETADVLNSVIAGNLANIGAGGGSAGGGGGGLFFLGVRGFMTHTTIADNAVGSASMGGHALTLLNSGAISSEVDLDYVIVANHDGPINVPVVKVQSTNTLNLRRGIYANNIDDDNEGDPGAGTINVIEPMLSFAAVKFVSPGAPDFDYHLQGDSPAIDQATSSTTTLDLDQDMRDSEPDIGADELDVSLIFADGFESGNTSAWTFTVN